MKNGISIHLNNSNDRFYPISRTVCAWTVPAVLERAGRNAVFAADEFFAARISNPHTRRAYARVVRRFLAWCEDEHLELPQVSPGLAGRFIDELPGDISTKNQAQDLLGSIDTSHVVGLRDRALLGTLAYTGARIGAVARLRRGDLEDQGPQRVLRFREKGGKQREIPVRHDLDRWLGDYLEAAGIEDAPKETPLFRSALGKQKQLAAAGISEDPKETPLFRSALGKQKQLSPRPLSANSMGLMLKRRLKDAGLPPIFSPHSFRVLVVTDLLSQDVTLEDVQYLAGHANPRTTQIYDRRRRRVTRNIVERISV